MAAPFDSLPDDPRALKAIILAQQSEIARLTATGKAFDALVQALKIRIAKLRKQKFGSSSEKIEREIEQLQLALENLEVAAAAADPSPAFEEGASEQPTEPVRRQRGSRGSAMKRRASCSPRHGLRCGGPLRLLGEDVSAVLDFVAARLKVTETARTACRATRQCGKGS